jgi:hypothetical protein
MFGLDDNPEKLTSFELKGKITICTVLSSS